MITSIRLILAVVVMLLAAGFSVAQELIIPIEVEILYEGTSVGTVQSITVGSGQITVAAVLRPELFGTLDSKLNAMGDLERSSWSRRVYWRGGTRILSGVDQNADRLKLSSRVTFDLWTRINLLFDELKTRLFETTHSVEWEFWIPNAAFSNVSFYVRVTNIRDFPNDLEELLGVRMTEALDLPLPLECGACTCQDLSQRAGLMLSNVSFVRRGDNSVDINITFGFDMESGMAILSECLLQD